eukprot:COSAG02_NODE_11389_length_1733_cov_1.650551_1_plen_63_part_00
MMHARDREVAWSHGLACHSRATGTPTLVPSAPGVAPWILRAESRWYWSVEAGLVTVGTAGRC